MSVGAFPGLANSRRTVRAEINPMDKSTIVSIYPISLDERKSTIQPSRYQIPRGTLENPSTLIVGPASWWKDPGGDGNEPLIEITNSSIQVAKSIVTDYSNGMLAFNQNAKPGLFFVPGAFTVKEIKEKHYDKLLEASAKQKNWFLQLVELADMLWSTSNGNPRTISDQMRLAADELQMKDKPWLAYFQAVQLVNCPNCGSLRNSNYPTCPNCKAVIDQKKFVELGLKFAN